MSIGPRVALTPLELLENDGTREVPFLNKIFAPLICGSVAFTCVLISNWATRRPVLSGIQKHIVITAGFALLGSYAGDYRDRYYAERDAVYRHYVQLHPEDFPPHERVLYKDVLEKWYPIR